MLKSARGRILFAALICFLLVAGFGCKNSSAGQVQPVKLDYWTVFDDVDELRVLASKYTQDHPYLTITVRQFRAEDLYPRLVEALAEDKGPDIISVRNRWLNKFQSKLAPLPPSVNDTTVQITKGRFKNDIVVNTQKKSTVTLEQLDREYVKAVKSDVVRSGKVYGLPLSFDTMALYYNKDLLDRSGIAEPPATWKEFQVDVKKLAKLDTANEKIIQAGAAMGTGRNVPGSDDLLYILFRQSNLSFIDSSGQAVFNSALTNDPETGAAKVMNFYTDFANNKRDTYTWNESMSDALSSFTNGSLAFFFGYHYHAALMRTRAPQLNFAIAPMPQLNEASPVNVANYWVQSVTQKSKHQNEAWAFLLYLTRSSAIKEYLDKTNRPTALRTYIAAQSELPALAPFVSQVLSAENWYHGDNYEAAVQALSDMSREWLRVPEDPNRLNQWQQEVLNRAAQKVNQTL